VRSEVEHHLVQAEIERQLDILARDQSQISFWDKAVIALSGDLDEDFVTEEIVDWMWADFGIESSVVVMPDDRPLLTVFRDMLSEPLAGLPYVALSRDLIESARLNYLARRTAAEDTIPRHVADIRMVNGQFGVVVAQAIFVDDEEENSNIPPLNAMPQVFLTFKPLTQSAFSEIGRNLGLGEFRVTPVSAAEEGHSSMVINQVAGQPPLAASWKVEQPSMIIWNRSIGALVGSFILVTVALLLISLRYGRALKSLQLSEAVNRHRATHDNLTGLPNRLQFDHALDTIIAKNRQDRCAILCLDLDQFKLVNDTHGHQVGDVVLKTAARRIADAVGDAGMAARVGGDEFIILLWDKLERVSVLDRCDRIIASVCEEIAFDGGVARIGAIIGVAWWPDDALSAKNIVRSADEALYRAKDNGRGQAWFAGDTGDARLAVTERRRPAPGVISKGFAAA